jgi:hypothetical protein
MVGEQEMHGLLYAEDLVLLSLTAESAQRQLHALASFCVAFGLEVNQSHPT